MVSVCFVTPGFCIDRRERAPRENAKNEKDKQKAFSFVGLESYRAKHLIRSDYYRNELNGYYFIDAPIEHFSFLLRMAIPSLYSSISGNLNSRKRLSISLIDCIYISVSDESVWHVVCLRRWMRHFKTTDAILRLQMDNCIWLFGKSKHTISSLL